MSKPRQIPHQPSRSGYKKRSRPSSDDRASTRQKKCYHHLKLLQKALKKARQFEVGKLKRRVKTAGSQQEREKLAAQLSALSRLDLDAAAQQAAVQGGIASSTATVSHSPTDAAGNMPAISAAAASDSPMDAGGTEPNSAADVLLPRLLAAKAVREEVASAQKALAALDSAAAAADMRQQQRQARDLLKQQKQQQRQEEKQGAAASNTSKGAPDNDGSPSEAADGAAGGSRQREMDDFGNFDDGSGVSSSGDSGSNIDSSSDKERGLLKRKRQLLLGNGPQKQPSPGEGPSEGAVTSHLPTKSAKPKQPKKPKNRLGQRARRQQAERDFGAGANHLPPRPMNGRSLPPPPPHPPAAAGGGQQQRVGNHVEGASSRDDGGRVDASKDAVHPSWAASAKAKQQLAAKPAGTKVVFGDDGEVAATKPPPAAAAPQEASYSQRPRQPQTALPSTTQSGSSRGSRLSSSASGTGAPQQLPQPPKRRGEREAGVPRTTTTVPAITAKRMVLAKSHPSWEAKAKLRAQMSALPKPQGMKTVFTD